MDVTRNGRRIARNGKAYTFEEFAAYYHSQTHLAETAPPGQTLALSMLNKASVRTGSRCSGLVDTRRKYRADYDAGEELLVDASETHERRRARDGIKYTKAEFIDFWGEKRGQVMWEDAGDTQERRRACDGILYTKGEFFEYGGEKLAPFLWEEASGRSLTPEPSEEAEFSRPGPFLLPSETNDRCCDHFRLLPCSICRRRDGNESRIN